MEPHLPRHGRQQRPAGPQLQRGAARHGHGAAVPRAGGLHGAHGARAEPARGRGGGAGAGGVRGLVVRAAGELPAHRGLGALHLPGPRDGGGGGGGVAAEAGQEQEQEQNSGQVLTPLSSQ